jgi:hypothetical protein
MPADVRSGSKPEVFPLAQDVRSALKSRRRETARSGPFWHPMTVKRAIAATA